MLEAYILFRYDAVKAFQRRHHSSFYLKAGAECFELREASLCLAMLVTAVSRGIRCPLGLKNEVESRKYASSTNYTSVPL